MQMAQQEVLVLGPCHKRGGSSDGATWERERGSSGSRKRNGIETWTDVADA